MDKAMKRYISGVRRRLNLPKDIRKRVLSDLQTDLTARLEQGEDWDTIRASLGKPAAVAAELNEQMKEYAYRKSPWRFAFLAAAIIAGVKLLYNGGIWLFGQYLLHRAQAVSVGIIGGADGPTAIFVTAPGWIRTALWLLVLVVGIAGFLMLRKREK